MHIKAIKTACFSPTGTSRKVAEAIVRGIGVDTVEAIDITRPDVRETSLHTSPNNLLIVAVPVYMGRVPALLEEWLSRIQADNTPAVAVVVYGNRAYENSLLELSDVLKSRGCVPVAGAAYIGEHSFSKADTPVAQGRPDAVDLQHAEAFGREIMAKIQAAEAVSELSEAHVPGEHPYGGVTKLWDVDFIAVGEDCDQCGLCAEICPVGAVSPDDSALIDTVKCITCCACIKHCPENARTIKPGPVMDASHRLAANCSAPRQPESYL